MSFEEDILAKVGRRGVLRTVHSPPDLTDSIGRLARPAGKDAPVCHERYGRWVPGGDHELALEDIAERVIRGILDYETGVRLAESLVDAMGKRDSTETPAMDGAQTLIAQFLKDDRRVKQLQSAGPMVGSAAQLTGDVGGQCNSLIVHVRSPVPHVRSAQTRRRPEESRFRNFATVDNK